MPTIYEGVSCQEHVCPFYRAGEGVAMAMWDPCIEWKAPRRSLPRSSNPSCHPPEDATCWGLCCRSIDLVSVEPPPSTPHSLPPTPPLPRAEIDRACLAVTEGGRGGRTPESIHNSIVKKGAQHVRGTDE